ncbi:RTA1 like protein-domain-containing protein [Xylogone sp. PMI_703]|nr:RTA1 like protein-domain-containing protein [Xylogone sp. PMI_703]
MADMTCKEIGPGCPADGSSLGYPPNVAASVIFMGLFGVSLLAHTALGWKYKTWSFMTAMFLGSSSELIGYLGRILMHNNPYKLSTLGLCPSMFAHFPRLLTLNRFLVQIVCLTTAPAFYSAGIYLCLSRIVIVYGEGISRVNPVWYTRFFIACDIISLSLQGGGGGVASAATKPSTMNLGNHLMLAGLIFQIISLVAFAATCVDFALRVRRYPSWKTASYSKLRENVKFRGFLWALTISFITIFIRCVYRVIELGKGWDNSLMRKEAPFVILESCMITIAVFALILFHPGFGFQNKFNDLKYHPVPSEESGKEGVSLMGQDTTYAR